jgi:PAS domain S-box-containing protein
MADPAMPPHPEVHSDLASQLSPALDLPGDPATAASQGAPATWLDEHFRALFDEFPDGVVILDPTEVFGKWPIVACNQAFLKMNGYSYPAELVGRDIRDVSFETALQAPSVEEHRREYYERLSHNTSIRIKEKHIRRDGSIFWIQVSSCLLKQGGREWVLGVDRDITDEQEYLEDLRKDVGRTFHTVTATLLEVQLATEPIAGALGESPFPAGLPPSAEDGWRQLVGPRDQLTAALGRLDGTALPPASVRDTTHPWGPRLLTLKGLLEGLELSTIPELRVPVLHDSAREICTIMTGLVGQPGATQLVRARARDITQKAQTLDRLACQLVLGQIADRVIDTDELLRAVRERVLRSVRPAVKPELFGLWALVRETIGELANYSHHKHVEMRTHDSTGAKQVLAVKHEIKQVIYNLLHNAIKYSYSRPGSDSWVDVHGDIKNDRLRIQLTDRGVPIPRDEIERGDIYQLGFRGRLSGESGRSGTGIGLYEARELARANDGDVWLTSRPALRNAPADDLSLPHVVTATLDLPISYQLEGSSR